MPWRRRSPPNRATRRAAAAISCGGGWPPSRCSAGAGRSRAGCRSTSPFRPSPRPSRPSSQWWPTAACSKAYLLTLQPLVIGVVVSAVLGVSVGVAMGLRQSVEWAGRAGLHRAAGGAGGGAHPAGDLRLRHRPHRQGASRSACWRCRSSCSTATRRCATSIRRWSPCAARSSARGCSRSSKIILPDASPVIFAGLRLGISAGFIGVILAELLITPTGIGDLITYHRSVANYARDVRRHRLDHRVLRRHARASCSGSR